MARSTTIDNFLVSFCLVLLILHFISDTNVLVNLIAKIGIHETLQNLEGDFSFVAYNFQLNQLYVARDRFGAKPLIGITLIPKIAFPHATQSYAL